MTNAEAQEELFAVIAQYPGRPERYWPLVVEFVADWMKANISDAGDYFVDDLGAYIADEWREHQS